jgi:hypothetical protein
MEQQYNGLQMSQKDAMSLKSRNLQPTLTIALTSPRSATIWIAEKGAGSLTLLLPFVKPILTFLICLVNHEDDGNSKDDPDSDCLSENAEAYASHLVATMAGLIASLKTVAQVSGTIQ